MSSKEVGIEDGRKKLGDLADAAKNEGQITYLTRHGRRIAAIVPAHLAPQEPAMTVTLYETNSDLLILARGSEAWSLVVEGDHMEAMFAKDAEAWIDGDWEPSEADGIHPAEVADDLREVATWKQEGGLHLLVEFDSLGGGARDYIGEPFQTFQILASDGTEDTGAAPAWLIVDDSDAMVESVPFEEGDQISDAIARFVTTGHLPEGSVMERAERMHNPYPWQPKGYGYRWHVSQ